MYMHNMHQLTKAVHFECFKEEIPVRIDFTPRGPGLGRKVGFLPGNQMDFTPRCSGSGRKVNFYRNPLP